MSISRSNRVAKHVHTAADIIDGYAAGMARTAPYGYKGGDLHVTGHLETDNEPTFNEKIILKDPAGGGDYIYLECVMVEDTSFPGTYNPIFRVTEGMWGFKDIFCMGFLGSSSHQNAVGGGALMLGSRLTGVDDPPRIILSDYLDAAGSSATGHVHLTAGVITSVDIDAGGSGYTSPPKAILTGGTPESKATLTTVLTADAVTSVTIDNGGSGYTATPTLTFIRAGFDCLYVTKANTETVTTRSNITLAMLGKVACSGILNYIILNADSVESSKDIHVNKTNPTLNFQTSTVTKASVGFDGTDCQIMTNTGKIIIYPNGDSVIAKKDLHIEKANPTLDLAIADTTIKAALGFDGTNTNLLSNTGSIHVSPYDKSFVVNGHEIVSDNFGTYALNHHAIRIDRDSVVNDSQFIDFFKGAACDIWIGRKENDDNFFVSKYTGAAVIDLFKVDVDGHIYPYGSCTPLRDNNSSCTLGHGAARWYGATIMTLYTNKLDDVDAGFIEFNVDMKPTGDGTINFGTNVKMLNSIWTNWLNTTDVSGWDALDDLALIKNYKMKNKAKGDVLDIDSLPFLKALSPEGKETQCWDITKTVGFALGVGKACAQKIESIEKRLGKLERA